MKNNNYKIDLVKCKICDYQTTNHQSFNSHIAHAHKLTSKQYYDLYLKQPNEGLCKECGKPTNFVSIWKYPHYRDFCCNRCVQNNKEIQHKKFNTVLEHYGVEHPMKSTDVKNTLKNTMLDKYGVDNAFKSDIVKNKIKQTNMTKYGVDNPAKSKIVQEKTKQTNLEKYNCEWVTQSKSVKQKQQDTLYKNYNVIIPCKSEEIKNKVKQTTLKKYGVKCVLQLDSVRTQTYKTAYTSIARSKACKTMRLRGNRSKLEDYFEDLLISNHILYEVEHKDEKYPYFCDFYLPNLTMYIEINGYWTHNNHIFNSTNNNDIHTLELWKSKNTEQYKTAVYVWSILDVEKYNCAKNNNLNYVILWNKHDIDNFIKTLI